AARYHYLGFRIAEETLALMRSMVASGEAEHLVAERVWKEMQRALGERSPADFVSVLRDCNALTRALPELDHLFGIATETSTVGDRALDSLKEASQLSSDTMVRFATLLHPLNEHQPTDEGSSSNSATTAARHNTAIQQLCERITTPKNYR